MNRLIKKDKYGEFEPIKHNAVCEKLHKLEDIEEELGCPLDVVFKALKDTYIQIIHKGERSYSVDFALENYSGKWYFSTYDKAELYLLKDYGKTWWLKEDRSVMSK